MKERGFLQAVCPDECVVSGGSEERWRVVGGKKEEKGRR